MRRVLGGVILTILVQFATAQEHIASRFPPGYHSYEEIISLADSLASAYPAICKKVLFGTSLGGRQLAALEITDSVNTDEGEPKVLFDGGCHGDEIGGSENLIRFARDLCTRYGTDSAVTGLVNSREIWLYLMVNPDGRVNMSRFNDSMVDVNRDYGYMWDASGGSPSAFSQPETRGVRNCMESRAFSFYISYHSGFQQVAYPWACRPPAPPDVPNLYTLSLAYASASLYPSLNYGQSYYIMYPSNGMAVDYFYGTTGQACFTMEISNDKQPPDPEVFYATNYPAMLEMIQDAGYGISGWVKDSVTGLPVKASVWVDYFFPVYTGTSGDYHKFLLPGSHTLTVRANGYASRTIPEVMVPQNGAAVEDILLVPDSGLYAFRVCSVSNPGTNPNDPAWTPGALEAPDGLSYSLGVNGWIILDLGDTVADLPGNDLAIYEAGDSNEGFTCYGSLSEDGPFSLIGTGLGTTFFDLGPGGLIRYVKIQDDGDGDPLATGAGYDLDAVEGFPGTATHISGNPGMEKIWVYPNPSRGLFTLELPDDPVKLLMVSDIYGHPISNIPHPASHITVDLSCYPDGLYLCTLQTPFTTRTIRLAKIP